MTTVAHEILNCPKCNEKMKCTVCRSTNNLGAKLYTDGSYYGSYGSGSIISFVDAYRNCHIECPHCESIFMSSKWISSFRGIIPAMISNFNEKKEDIPHISALSFSSIIWSGLESWRNSDEEKIFRIKAWNEFNIERFEKINREVEYLSTEPKKYENEDEKEELRDMFESLIEFPKSYAKKSYDLMPDWFKNKDFEGYVAYHKKSMSDYRKRIQSNPTKFDLKPYEVSNLEKLISLLDENSTVELILKAEAYRHLSDFEKTINLLADKKKYEEESSWGELLIELALKKDNELKERTDVKIQYHWER
jgi:hypothetical protein